VEDTKQRLAGSLEAFSSSFYGFGKSNQTPVFRHVNRDYFLQNGPLTVFSPVYILQSMEGKHREKTGGKKRPSHDMKDSKR
jgi:hypothetical protein